MQAKLLSFLFISCFALVQSTPLGFFDAGNANAFVDQIINAVKTQYGTTLDPFHVPEKTLNFSQKVGIITLKGDAHLTDGVITGLSHLHRSGDSDIGTENGHFIGHLKLGDDNIKATFKVAVNFMKIFHPHLTLESDIENIDMMVTIGVDANGKPQVNGFHVDELKHVKIYVHGLGLLDPLVDLIADSFVQFFNPTARDLLSNLLKGMIGDLLKDFKLPGTGF